MIALSEQNFLNSIVAALDVIEEDLSLNEIDQLLDEYQNGSAVYTYTIKRFKERAQEINTY